MPRDQENRKKTNPTYYILHLVGKFTRKTCKCSCLKDLTLNEIKKKTNKTEIFMEKLTISDELQVACLCSILSFFCYLLLLLLSQMYLLVCFKKKLYFWFLSKWIVAKSTLIIYLIILHVHYVYSDNSLDII